MRVILDVHNYARYSGVGHRHKGPARRMLSAICGEDLASDTRDNDTVIFGLMNEPNGLPTETWLDAANIAIAEIRRTGAKNLILVPGNGWSSARRLGRAATTERPMARSC